MPDRATFLRHILETHEDDSARLDFADWLEQQGDPHARFIRLQCAAAQAKSFAERSNLEREARDWLREYEKELIADIRKFIVGWKYHRGLVHHVIMTPPQIVDGGAHVFASWPIDSLEIAELTEADHYLDRLPFLSQLRALHLQVQLNTARLVSEFQSFTNVQSLNLDFSRISVGALEALINQGPWEKLYSLSMRGIQLRSESSERLAHFLLESEKLAELLHLDLTDSRISPHNLALLRARFGGTVIC